MLHVKDAVILIGCPHHCHWWDLAILRSCSNYETWSWGSSLFQIQGNKWSLNWQWRRSQQKIIVNQNQNSAQAHVMSWPSMVTIAATMVLFQWWVWRWCFHRLRCFCFRTRLNGRPHYRRSMWPWDTLTQLINLWCKVLHGWTTDGMYC